MKAPKFVAIVREPEPLLRQGHKYVAYVVRRVPDGIAREYPLYLHSETVDGLKQRVLETEPVSEWFHAYRERECFEIGPNAGGR